MKPENRWITPEGLEDMEVWRDVMQLEKEAGYTESWKGYNLEDGDMEEADTWGIDCFTRRNLELALEWTPIARNLEPPDGYDADGLREDWSKVVVDYEKDVDKVAAEVAAAAAATATAAASAAEVSAEEDP